MESGALAKSSQKKPKAAHFELGKWGKIRALARWRLGGQRLRYAWVIGAWGWGCCGSAPCCRLPTERGIVRIPAGGAGEAAVIVEDGRDGMVPTGVSPTQRTSTREAAHGCTVLGTRDRTVKMRAETGAWVVCRQRHEEASRCKGRREWRRRSAGCRRKQEAAGVR